VRWLRNKWFFLAGITSLGFALDIVTKHMAVAGLTPGQPVHLVGDVFGLVLVYNRGAVFGIDPAHWLPGFPVNLFFIIFSLIAVAVVGLYYRAIAGHDAVARWGLAFILPGALGNVLDRVIAPGRGVVDFCMMNLHFPPFDPWPIFNAADAYVTVGVGLILLSIVRDEWARYRQRAASGS
jgi:signal peptidase II